MGRILTILIILTLLSSCRSVTKTLETVVKDSVVVREYDVPIHIKESTITHQIDLDSLCIEMEALKAELKNTRSGTTSIIYRQADNQILQAQIDSLGKMLVLGQRMAMDTIIKGQETISTTTTTTKKTTEKKATFFEKMGKYSFFALVVVLIIWLIRFTRANLPL